MNNQEKQEQSAVETVQTDTQSVQEIITNTEIGFEIECSAQEEKADGCVVADGTITSPDDPKATLSSYQYPTLELLRKADNDSVVIDMEELTANKNRIVEVLSNYGVQVSSIKATVGPTNHVV